MLGWTPLSFALFYVLVGWVTFGLCVWLGTASRLDQYHLTPFTAMVVFLCAFPLIWAAVIITFLTQAALWVFDRQHGPIAVVRDTVKAAGHIEFPETEHKP